MSFEKICDDIKKLKIQGATNVARAGLSAIKLKNNPSAIKKLLSLRSTEPLLQHAVHYAQKDPKRLGKFALAHINESSNIIAKQAAKKIHKSVYTHCHSSNVIEALRIAKKTKNFEVHCTETRPLQQGRRTANDCRKLKLKTYFYPDSAGRIAIKNSEIMLIGADAITPTKIYNKIGSELFCEIAHDYKKPIYVLADSWKYVPYEIPIEERPSQELWKNPPKGLHIVNHAFEKINPKLISGIITELGILTHKELIKKVPLMYPEIYHTNARGKKR